MTNILSIYMYRTIFHQTKKRSASLLQLFPSLVIAYYQYCARKAANTNSGRNTVSQLQQGQGHVTSVACLVRTAQRRKQRQDNTRREEKHTQTKENPARFPLPPSQDRLTRCVLGVTKQTPVKKDLLILIIGRCSLPSPDVELVAESNVPMSRRFVFINSQSQGGAMNCLCAKATQSNPQQQSVNRITVPDKTFNFGKKRKKNFVKTPTDTS